MPIQLPDLDNKTFAGLMEEMTASIPKYTKEWTNFNPSDPGMTILELLAWVSESLIYRANRISPEAYLNFLKLIAGDTVFDESDRSHKLILEYLARIGTELNAKQWKPDVEAMKGQATAFLHSRYRAVTEEDFQVLAKEALPGEIRKVEVVTSPFSVDVVVIPSFVPDKADSDRLCKGVSDYLSPRKLLGTVLTVRTARYSRIDLKIEAVSFSYANAATVKTAIEKTLRGYFDPVEGGPIGNGWPYGRDIAVYELCNVVEKVAGVKMIKSITSDKASFPIKIDGLIDHDNSTFVVTVSGEHEEKKV